MRERYIETLREYKPDDYIFENKNNINIYQRKKRVCVLYCYRARFFALKTKIEEKEKYFVLKFSEKN